VKLTDKARQLAETITLAELLLLEENDADAYLFKTIQLSVHNALREGSEDELWPELQRLCMAVGQEARDDAFKRAATRWKDRPVNDQPQAQPVEINQQRALAEVWNWLNANNKIVDFTRQTALQAVREAKPWSNPEQLQASFDNALSSMVSQQQLARISTGRYLVTARYPG
jgi:hypothetical protein